MPFETLQALEINEVVGNFIALTRPPENLRNQVDLTYKIENLSVIIFEWRPVWKKPKQMQECNIAKATFVKNKNYWKVFWLRADLKWHSYKPMPTVTTIKEFIKLVDEDELGCFWG